VKSVVCVNTGAVDGQCPTRFGHLSWSTVARSDRSWEITLDFPQPFTGDLFVHIHPPEGQPLRQTSAGTIAGTAIHLTSEELKSAQHLVIRAS
jgi:hypothetical protein